MAFDSDLDRRNARLSEPARRAILADDRRIVLVGARGWIGRSLLALLREALGPEAMARRVVCFGSSDAVLELDDGTRLAQRPLAKLAELEAHPSLLFHLAFLTKDKVAGMDAEAYAETNRALSRTVLEALESIGVDRLFVASSGAAAFADDPAAADDLRLYGALKRADEDRFAAWAEAAPERRRAAIGRIYAVSGPYINKHDTYALASFIADALAGRPIAVRAPMRVLRSYVAVRELLSFVLAHLLADDGRAALRFETGGEALELGAVAQVVAQLAEGEMHRAPITVPHDNRYVGDDETWREHLARFGMTPVSLEDQLAETMAYLGREQAASVTG